MFRKQLNRVRLSRPASHPVAVRPAREISMRVRRTARIENERRPRLQ